MARKYRPAHDGQGNHSGRDKHGRVFWVDRGGRRTTFGAEQKPSQPRDEYGRKDSRTREGGHTRLPPYRDEQGKFQKHPAKVAAEQLHKGVIGKDEFRALADDYELSEREIWDMYDQVYG